MPDAIQKPILAIDPGTRDTLGYAVMDGPMLYTCGVLEGKVTTLPGVHNQLLEIVQKHGVKTIIIEDFTYWYNEEKQTKKKNKSNMGSVYVALKMKELIGFLMGFFRAYRIPIEKVQPRWWRARISDLDAVYDMYADQIERLNYNKGKVSHIKSAIAIAMAIQGYHTKSSDEEKTETKARTRKSNKTYRYRRTEKKKTYRRRSYRR